MANINMANIDSRAETVTELHPRALNPRLARACSAAQRLPGWGRLVNLLIGSQPSGAFRVHSANGWFEGNIASFIDQQVYLYGWYESDVIAAFLDVIPPDRRGVILDIGANVGTHAIAFSQAFQTIHAFEPNPLALEQLERNVALNGATNIQIHPIGLSETAATLDFFLTEKSNYGLGTFSQNDQYDVPLQKVGEFSVEVGDELLERIGCKKVDAVKVDVQGFEPEVLRGLKQMLTRDKPFLWFEVSTATSAKLDDLKQLAKFVPYPFSLHVFPSFLSLTGRKVRLQEVDSSQPLPCGDYVAMPR
jgi:FkbM family methyltransferase